MRWYSVSLYGRGHAYVEATSKQRAHTKTEEELDREVHSIKQLVMPDLIELIEQYPEAIESERVDILHGQTHLGTIE